MSKFDDEKLYASNQRLAQYLLSIFMGQDEEEEEEELKLEALNLILSKPFGDDFILNDENILRGLLLELSNTSLYTYEFRSFAKKLLIASARTSPRLEDKIEFLAKEMFQFKNHFEYLSYASESFQNEHANSNVFLERTIDKSVKEMTYTLKQFMSDEGYLRFLDFSLVFKRKNPNEKQIEQLLDFIRVST